MTVGTAKVHPHQDEPQNDQQNNDQNNPQNARNAQNAQNDPQNPQNLQNPQNNPPNGQGEDREPASIPAIIGAFVFVGIGLGVDYLLWRNDATTSVIHPEDTTTVFAVTVVLAAGVERLIEPFTRWVGRAKNHVANRTVLIWGLATAVATVASAISGFYLLHSIAGANWNGIPVWADALITGLIVGSGTKPVHDLITRAQGTSSN